MDKNDIDITDINEQLRLLGKSIDIFVDKKNPMQLIDLTNRLSWFCKIKTEQIQMKIWDKKVAEWKK